jgi:hypothetical protein
VSIFDDLAQVTRDLLAPSEFGATNPDTSSAITLTRRTLTPGANAWDDPTETLTTQSLRAQAFGVSSELVGTPANEPDGPVVLASDRIVISEVPTGGYRVGDILAIDGAAVTVLRMWRIPAAGTPSAVKFLVRGTAGSEIAPWPGAFSEEFSTEFG